MGLTNFMHQDSWADMVHKVVKPILFWDALANVNMWEACLSTPPHMFLWTTLIFILPILQCWTYSHATFQIFKIVESDTAK